MAAAARREGRQAVVDQRNRVEAVRIGTVIAHDKRALSRWRSQVNRATLSQGRPAGGGKSRGLTGRALEKRIMTLRRDHPDIVAVRVA